MIRRPPRSTRTDTLFPYTSLFRSPHLLLPPVHCSLLGAGLYLYVGGPSPSVVYLIARLDPVAGHGLVADTVGAVLGRSEEHTSELQSLMRISYAVFCLKKKKIRFTIYEYIFS